MIAKRIRAPAEIGLLRSSNWGGEGGHLSEGNSRTGFQSTEKRILLSVLDTHVVPSVSPALDPL